MCVGCGGVDLLLPRLMRVYSSFFFSFFLSQSPAIAFGFIFFVLHCPLGVSYIAVAVLANMRSRLGPSSVGIPGPTRVGKLCRTLCQMSAICLPICRDSRV